MEYVKQDKNYTCANACFRMVLSAQGLPDVEESVLEGMMGTLPECGTGYQGMVDAAHQFCLECVYGENGTVELIDNLTRSGWTVVVALSVDVPHYAVYQENNGNHLFLADPFFGESVPHLINKFKRATWLVDTHRYTRAVKESNLKFGNNINTKGWYVAYKKNYENR